MFRNTRPDDLLVAAIRGALKQVPTLDPKAIEDAIVGCAMPEGEQGLNVARIGALLAGLPNTVGGVTVNRFCASGLTAIQMAADRIRVGEADVMIAGGVESMSMVPMSGNKPSFNPAVFMRDENVGIAYGMGMTAEKRRAAVEGDARGAGRVRAAVAPEGAEGDGGRRVQRRDHAGRGDRPLAESRRPAEVTTKTRTASTDEGPRADTTLEALAKLRPVFAAKGSVTAGNSSQTSDGAGCLILASDEGGQDLRPARRWRASSASRTAACRPRSWASARSRRSPRRCATPACSTSDLDWIELNEAFAAQALAVLGTLHLDPARVNPLGGAIALGHPLGATGAIRAATVVHALRRHNLKYGMVTMCVGTGQGAAGIFERV